MDKINHNELQDSSTTCIFIAALGGNTGYQVWS